MLENKNIKDIKLVVFDLDGTLLADDATIGAETKKLVRQLQQDYGVQFTFASGRLHSALTAFAEELQLKVPLISLDGCLIKSHPEGKIIFESFVKPKYVRKAIAYANTYLLNIALCHADAIYYTETNAIIPQIMDKFGAKYLEVESYDNYCGSTLEIVFAGDHKESIKYIRDRMHFPYSFGLNTSYFKSHTNEGIYYLEIRRKGSSKAKGLQRLMKHLRLKPEQTVVMGDWYNDISLFQTNAFKVALSNAVPEIKRMADLITERSNNEDGTAEFLEKILRAKKDN